MGNPPHKKGTFFFKAESTKIRQVESVAMALTHQGEWRVRCENGDLGSYDAMKATIEALE